MATLRKRQNVSSMIGEVKDEIKTIDNTKIIDKTKVIGKLLKEIIIKNFKKINKNLNINELLKLLLGKSFWTPINIKEYLSAIGIRVTSQKLKIIGFIFNVINFYAVYLLLPTHVSIIIDPGTREAFNQAFSQLLKFNPAPLGLYILGKVIMNDSSFNLGILKMQPKFILKFENKINNLIVSGSFIGIRGIVKFGTENFFKKKIKMQGGRKIYKGSRGGKYYIKNKKKIYIKKN